MRCLDAGHPIPHGFVDGVAQGPRAGGDGAHFRTQQPHAEDIGGLPANVFFAHIDDAGQAEPCTGGGRGDTVLTGTCFGNDAFLAHAEGQQCLAERVIDLVGTGVIQIFAFQPDLSTATPARSDDERGTAGKGGRRSRVAAAAIAAETARPAEPCRTPRPVRQGASQASPARNGRQTPNRPCWSGTESGVPAGLLLSVCP